MTAIKLDQFGGMLPAWDAHLLPDGQAANARDGYFFSGALTGWRKPKLLRALTDSTAQFVYRIPKNNQAVAHATLTISTVPSDGDTVTVGRFIYRFKTVMQKPYDVLIGADKAAAASNLFDAITLDKGDETSPDPDSSDVPEPVGWDVTYARETGANDAVKADNCVLNTSGSNPTIYVEAPGFGVAYNATAVAESTSTVRMSWDDTTFHGGAVSNFDTSLTASDATWLEFSNRDTTVMRSPVVDDRFGRYYFSTPEDAPTYNTSDRIAQGLPEWKLGVPAPNVAPKVGVYAGGQTTVLGLKTHTTTHTDLTADDMLLVPITFNGAGQIVDVSCVPQTTDAAALISAVVYDDKDGIPGNLLGIGSEETGTTDGVTLTSVFTTPVGLLEGEQYWIGFICDSIMTYYNADALANVGSKKYTTTVYDDGPPSAAPSTPTASTADVQLWASVQSDAIQQNRAYLYTYATEYDEEGPASPPVLELGWSNSEWSIAVPDPPLADMGVDRNITKKRIYRTVAGTQGTAFFFVGEIPVGQGSYIDKLDDNEVAAHLGLSSSIWFPPPVGLRGVLSMPNGMAVGFKDNEVWFCEPYVPHAWPAAYALTTEYPIVGLGVTGQAVVICTSGTPYVAVGVNPATMTLTKILAPEPCISAKSIVSTDAGVFYASPNGLIQVTQSGDATNTTERWVTRDRWQELTPQANIAAIKLASGYFAFATGSAQQGYNIELATDTQSFTIWPQPGGHRIGYTDLTAPNDYDIANVQLDPWTGIGLLIQNGSIYYYDFSDSTPDITPYLWKSKTYHFTAAKALGAMKIYFTVPDGTTAQGTRNTAAFDDASWDTLAADQYGIVRVYGDGELICQREIRTNGEVLRLPADTKYEQYAFEVEARVVISSIQVASTLQELSRV